MASGTISIDELKALMRKVNQHLTSEEVDAIMRECDADGNRELDFEEFKQLMVSILYCIYIQDYEKIFCISFIFYIIIK